MNIKQPFPVFVVGLFITSAGICDTAIKCTPKNIGACSGGTSTHAGSGGGGVQWETTCSNIKYKGLAICAATSTTPTSKLTYTSGSNTTCWCRIITPVVSKWIKANSSSSETTCNDTCASSCLYAAQGSYALVSYALNSLL